MKVNLKVVGLIMYAIAIVILISLLISQSYNSSAFEYLLLIAAILGASGGFLRRKGKNKTETYQNIPPPP
jgi:hypothetical protein